MCTSVILIQNNNWPVIIASNRDEYFSRKSISPNRHWKNQPYIIGGLDKEAGGTWFSVNNNGVFGCILNRNFQINSFKPKKSRGEIILKILAGNNALESIKIAKDLDKKLYNGFNLIIGDNKNCFLIKNIYDENTLIIDSIAPGLSMLTNKEINDKNDKKICYFYNKFLKANTPEPNNNKWSEWENLLISESINKKINQEKSICFNIDNEFGTVSSSLLALSSIKNKFIYRYIEKPFNNSFYKDIKIL